MADRTKWTHEQDIILARAVREREGSKSQAFKDAGELLGKDWTQCSNRWYKVLDNPMSKGYLGVHLSFIEEDNDVPQQKVRKKRLFTRIISFMRNIF